MSANTTSNPSKGRRDLMLRVAQAVIVDPRASVAQLAAAAGVGRTTLHRAFGTRDELLDEVARFVIEERERLDARIGFADAPPSGVLAALAEVVLEWALVCDPLWSAGSFPADVDLAEACERLDRDLVRFVERAQGAGVLRADAAPIWLAYALGAQAMAAGHAVRAGDVGPRAAGDLFLSTISYGLARRP